MTILLAFKAEPELTMLPEQAWNDAQHGSLDLSYAQYQGGADEQAAAEIVLRQQATLNLTALTVGDTHAEPFMRYLNALGFARLVRIVPPKEAELRFSPQYIAALLARWVEQHPQSLILIGSQSSEGNNSQTGFWLAEQLGWPVLAGVVDFSLDVESEQMEAVLIQNDERLQCRVQLPAVLIVMNDGRYSLRVPGIRQKLAASKAEIICAPTEQANTQPDVKLKREQHRRVAQKIEGSCAQEKAQKLYDQYLRGQLSR